MQEVNLVLLHTFSDKMIPHVYMLGPDMMFGIFGQGFGAFVVDVERDCCTGA
jgi:hypothetical protein